MTTDLVLSNAKAYIEDRIMDCSLAINDGKIFKIGKEASMPKADTEIDLKNMLVLPGLVDVHVHLRDEGKEYKEDFYTGTAAAAAGGITTVLDMPNNDPTTMSVATLRRRMEIAERKILVNVGFYSEFPKNLIELGKIAKEGAISFKLYLNEQIGGLDINDDYSLAEAFKFISRLDVPVTSHAEDKIILERGEDNIRLLNASGIDAFLQVHSESAEVKAVERLLKIAEQTKVHVHFCHISTENGLGAIIDGKKSEIKTSCETTPHHIFLSSDDLRRIGRLALTIPPIREENHRTTLWNGVKKGQIDILASDHAPHALEDKKADSIWDVEAGIPGLETILPLLLTEVKRGRLSITDIMRLMSKRPTEIFGLDNRCDLKEGNSADVVVVDLDRKYKIDASQFHSRAKYSPFDGWNVQGKPVKTFVGGLLIADEGEIIAEPGSGNIIRRE